MRDPSIENRRQLGRVAAISIFASSILLVLAFLEVAFRVFNPLGISYYPETARYMDTLVLAGGVGYRNQPNLHGTFWGAPVSINSLGLRDREISLAPLPNEFRILVMGDSWPFGIGVRADQSLSYLLERMIAEDARENIPIRTIDMGVPSYNTEAELAQFQSLGCKLHPNLVVLLFAINDIEPKMWIFNKRRHWYVNWAQRSYVACVAFSTVRSTMDRAAARGGQQKGGSDTTGMYALYKPNEPRWLAIDNSMAELNRECRAEGVPFVVFSEAGPATPPGKLLASLGRRETFPVVPLSPIADPRWRGRAVDLRNSPTDGHPNVEGNRADATLIYENLRRLGLLDSVLKTPRPAAAEAQILNRERK